MRVPGERFRARSLTYRTTKARSSRCRGEKIPLSVSASAKRLHSIDAPQGGLIATGPNKWTWEAPIKPGVYPLKVKNPDGRHRGGFFGVRDGAEHERPPGRAECVSDRPLPGDAAEGQSDLHSAQGVHRGHQRQRGHESLAGLPHQGIPDQAEERLPEIPRARRAARLLYWKRSGRISSRAAGTRKTSSS